MYASVELCGTIAAVADSDGSTTPKKHRLPDLPESYDGKIQCMREKRISTYRESQRSTYTLTIPTTIICFCECLYVFVLNINQEKQTKRNEMKEYIDIERIRTDSDSKMRESHARENHE